MRAIIRNPLVVVAVSLLLPACQRAVQVTSDGPAPTVNPDFTVDQNLVGQGRSAWVSKGCGGCHSIGQGKRAGPDLLGVTERRTIEWLNEWLKDTDKMLDSDPIGQAMLQEYNNQRMPDMGLSDEQVTALIHYMADETNDRRGP